MNKDGLLFMFDLSSMSLTAGLKLIGFEIFERKRQRLKAPKDVGEIT